MSDIVDQTFTVIGGSAPASVLGPDDWCTEIEYSQVEACHIRSYLSRCHQAGCCFPPVAFFGISSKCVKGNFPVPTDLGLPAGLPLLPLGYHYPQTSTDRANGRACAGVWALERGKIYVAPWIQSTETLIVKWDGIKRSWTDSDPVDEDPLLIKAVEEYVRWKHQSIYERDYEAASMAQAAFVEARQMLIHQCREETRARACEPSQARAATSVTLFYNDEQSASASCPAGSEGDPVSVTIQAGTIASTVSVADANQKAIAEASRQATARLVCTTIVVTYKNTPQTATASCEQSEGAPPPDGSPVTVTIPADTVTSTVSQADADAKALAQAQQQAQSQLVCTFWNKPISYQAVCPTGTTGTPVSVTTPAHTYSSNISQGDADDKAKLAAKNAAETALVCDGGPVVFKNTAQLGSANKQCFIQGQSGSCQITVSVHVQAGFFSSTVSQGDANQQALNFGNALAVQQAAIHCLNGQCGDFEMTWPGL